MLARVVFVCGGTVLFVMHGIVSPCCVCLLVHETASPCSLFVLAVVCAVVTRCVFDDADDLPFDGGPDCGLSMKGATATSHDQT